MSVQNIGQALPKTVRVEQTRIMKTWAEVKGKAELNEMKLRTKLKPVRIWDVMNKELCTPGLNEVQNKCQEQPPKVPIPSQIGFVKQPNYGQNWQGFSVNDPKNEGRGGDRPKGLVTNSNGLEQRLNNNLGNLHQEHYFPKNNYRYEGEVGVPPGLENFSFYEENSQSPQIYTDWHPEGLSFRGAKWPCNMEIGDFVPDFFDAPAEYEENEIENYERDSTVDSYHEFVCGAHFAPHSSEVYIEEPTLERKANMHVPAEGDYLLHQLLSRQRAMEIRKYNHAISTAVREAGRRLDQQVFRSNSFTVTPNHVAPNSPYVDDCDNYPTRDVGLGPLKCSYCEYNYDHSFIADSHFKNVEEHISNRGGGENIIKIEMGRPYRLRTPVCS